MFLYHPAILIRVGHSPLKGLTCSWQALPTLPTLPKDAHWPAEVSDLGPTETTCFHFCSGYYDDNVPKIENANLRDVKGSQGEGVVGKGDPMCSVTRV